MSAFVESEIRSLRAERRLVLDQAFVWPRERVCSELVRLDGLILSLMKEVADARVRTAGSEVEAVRAAGGREE